MNFSDTMFFTVTLIIGISFILLPINVLIHIDEKSQRKAWIDKYCSNEFKKKLIKALGLILIALGVIVVLLSTVLIVFA